MSTVYLFDSLYYSAFHCHDEIPKINTLKVEKFILAHSLRGLTPSLLGGPISLGLWWGRIMMRSLEQSKAAHLMAAGNQREEGLGSQNPLQGHTSSHLTSFHWSYLLKVLPPSHSITDWGPRLGHTVFKGHLRSQPQHPCFSWSLLFTIWPWDQILYPPSSYILSQLYLLSSLPPLNFISSSVMWVKFTGSSHIIIPTSFGITKA